MDVRAQHLQEADVSAHVCVAPLDVQHRIEVLQALNVSRDRRLAEPAPRSPVLETK